MGFWVVTDVWVSREEGVHGDVEGRDGGRTYLWGRNDCRDDFGGIDATVHLIGLQFHCNTFFRVVNVVTHMSTILSEFSIGAQGNLEALVPI